MRKSISIVILVVFVCVTLSVATVLALNNTILANSADSIEYRQNLAQLRPDDGKYVNYAEEVKFDLARDPELKNQGLFWVSFNSQGKLVEIKADTEAGARIVDPNKPTMILVHGMMTDGHLTTERYYIGKYHADWDEFGVDTSTATNLPSVFNMAYLWLHKGWNVAFYHYERFASEPDYWSLEQKMWTWIEEEFDEKDNWNMGHETRYRKTNGEVVNSAIKYGVCEHFVAEYIRAMKLLPESMGENEIRIAAHSMGGQVVAPALFLLHELARDEVGQISKRCLPNRYVLMDTFFSAFLGRGADKDGWVNLISDMTVGKFNIAWTGKPFIQNTTGHTIAFILEYLTKQGMALEYYTEPGSFLYAAIPNGIRDAIHKYCSVVIIVTKWAEEQPNFNELTDPHNGVREWYLCSLATKQPEVKDSEDFTPNAGMSTEDLLKARGKYFYQIEGINNTITNNDVFEIRDEYPRPIPEFGEFIERKQPAE